MGRMPAAESTSEGGAGRAAPTRHWRQGFTPAIAVLGLLLAWVPGLGVLLSAAGLVMGIWGRRNQARVRTSTWAIGLSIVGLAVGMAFTAAHLLLLPRGESGGDPAAWERFEERFEAPQPPGDSPRP